MELNWGGPGYSDYQGYMKVSGAERTAAGQQANITTSLSNYSQSLMSMANTQFSEMQGLLNNTIIPQLTQMATNPQGFGMQALAEMKGQAIDTIGGQAAAQSAQLRQSFASQNLAGLQSGVQQALHGQLGQAAAGQEATALRNIDIANQQARMQQQEFGLSGLMQSTSLLGQAPQSAGLAIQAGNAASTSAAQQFNEAYKMSQQGGFWSNLLQSGLGMAGMGLIGAGPLAGILGGFGTAGNVLGTLLGGTGTGSASMAQLGGPVTMQSALLGVPTG